MPDPDTAAFRFRDLVAETIREHQEVINKNGSAWWGWWNKPDEATPVGVFESFLKHIKASGDLEIYLVDSGTSALYRAKLIDIQYSANEVGIASPDPTITPAYYSTRSYKAWLRLSSINKETSTSLLKNFSYFEVDAFIEDPDSELFNDKRVFNLPEMLSRKHRTIYFLQKYIKKAHTAWDARPRLAIQPVNFVTTKPPIAHSNYIIHLSDMHFGDKHGFSAVKTDRLSIKLTEDLKEAKLDQPAALLLTGDFTWTGTKQEYARAAEFISDLKSILSLENTQIVVLPGNHDIQWGTGTASYDPKQAVQRAKAKAEQNYVSFYTEVFGLAPSHYFSSGRRIILGNFQALDIIGLNSSLLEQKHFAGYGQVCLEQLNSAAKEMGWTEDRGIDLRTQYRLLCLHHHIVPVNAQEPTTASDLSYSLTLDAEQILYRSLELGVDLICHGHMHQPFVATVARASSDPNFPTGRSVAIHGAGSVGVERSHLGRIGKNSYTVITFQPDFVDISIRASGDHVERFENHWACRLQRGKSGVTPGSGLFLTNEKVS